MVVYAYDDLFLYRASPSSLMGVAYHSFYSLPKNSLRKFHDVTDAFYSQFASRKKFQRNNNHLLIVKKSKETLKNYVNYFQSQMAPVYNCNEDVVVAAFISRLQVTNPFYIYMWKNDVTKMRDIYVQEQKYIQICLLYTSPSPRDRQKSRMPSSA